MREQEREADADRAERDAERQRPGDEGTATREQVVASGEAERATVTVRTLADASNDVYDTSEPEDDED